MDLEKTEVKNDCAGEFQQQFNRLIDRVHQLRVTVMRSEKLVAEDRENSGKQRKGDVRRWKPLLRSG
jgi:hypothetical protein